MVKKTKGKSKRIWIKGYTKCIIGKKGCIEKKVKPHWRNIKL